MTPVHILIADDHDLVRRGVRAVLEGQPGWTVCGEAGTGREAVAMAIALRPDVVVLDISMPGLNGLEATRQIRRAVSTKILILTVHESDQVVSEVLDAGAHGYMLKADAGRTLVDAINQILGQREFVTPRMQAVAARRSTPRRETLARRTPDSLTPREREVLQLLAEGRSNKEIGTTLGMTTRTAETHREHIMSKLDLHSMSELVRYAIRNRVIQA